jgi:hypothetical protein
MNHDEIPLESLFQKARLTPDATPDSAAPYGFSTRVAALGLEARKEQARSGLAWRLAWASLLPAMACLAFLLLSQGSLNEIWAGDPALSGIREELLLP